MKTNIINIELVKNQKKVIVGEDIKVNVKFSLAGSLRDVFTEKNWTNAYNNNDILLKIKYGIQLRNKSFIKNEIYVSKESYRKASIFWTRNPRLVNPMHKKRVWVQVIKNFESYIKLTESDVRKELFDFNEEIILKSSLLGKGKHDVSADIYASWQKHEYIEPDHIKNDSQYIEIEIN